MSPLNLIRLTAEGMIRNYGNGAADEAEAIAKRHLKPPLEGQKLWLAVAAEIRAIRSMKAA